MVFFVLTRAGYDELVSLLGNAPSPLWVNLGVLTDLELTQLRQRGCEVTNFTRHIESGDNSAIEVALATVREHHVGHRVWVEYAADL